MCRKARSGLVDDLCLYEFFQIQTNPFTAGSNVRTGWTRHMLGWDFVAPLGSEMGTARFHSRGEVLTCKSGTKNGTAIFLGGVPLGPLLAR